MGFEFPRWDAQNKNLDASDFTVTIRTLDWGESSYLFPFGYHPVITLGTSLDSSSLHFSLPETRPRPSSTMKTRYRRVEVIGDAR